MIKEDTSCDTSKENFVAEWAYPHPYDESVEKSRFLDSSGTKYRDKVDQWKLHELVKLWEETDGEETWPWVWCLWNPVGPHHVFVGINDQSLQLASQIANANRNNNLTIVVTSIAEIEKFAPVSEFHKCRCGVIECPVQQTDVEHKILMLKDERIICYDHAYLS